MYKIRVRSDFSGAHNLRGYKGKCEALHGHNWQVEVEASGEEVGSSGMILDFKELKDVLSEAISGMDHKYLNDINYFKEVNPTSENIAKYIYKDIVKKRPDIKLCGVTVWETDTSSATYSE